MAPTKPALDLNAMITADRQRRKNETLAKEIFGKNRRSSAPGPSVANNRRAGSAVPSLASRIGSGGVTKRSISVSTNPRAAAVSKAPAGNVDAEWTHDLHSLNNTASTNSGRAVPPRGPKFVRGNRNNDRLFTALHGSASSPALSSQFNVVSTSKPAPTMSIRGLAGPYIVVAKNLAAGTTAADIESAMTPVGGIILGCRLISERPRVIAELIFETKEGADNVVDTFNNQNADGNILHVYHKLGALPAAMKNSNTPIYNPSATVKPQTTTPLGPRADIRADTRTDTHADRPEDTRAGYAGSNDRYNPTRERSRDRRRDYNRGDVMDGSYGFDDRMDTDETEENTRGRGLYSDNLIHNNSNSNRGRSDMNGRDRGGRGGDRSRGYR